MTPLPFIVHRRSKETSNTFTLDLKSASGEFQFEPGQFNMLYAFGVGEVPISISGKPSNSQLLTHTIRDVGKVTCALGRLRKGDHVGVRGPFGSAWPVNVAEGRDVVIAAGGIGLAPIRPAIEHILENRQQFGRVVILYGARTPDDLLYTKDLTRWSGRLDVEVLVTVDRATHKWRGGVGVITKIIELAPIEPDNTVAFVCGPEIMMTFVVQHLKGRGLNTENIFVSVERNMQCGIGRCGHCQIGPTFVCREGPVYRYTDIGSLLSVRML